jgi:hypothetical protein
MAEEHPLDKMTFEQIMAAQKPIHDAEEAAVRKLGDAIGYGRMMQLAERIWNEKQPGGAHSTGPCVFFLVPCPHLTTKNIAWLDENGHCDWCCGAGRVTKRVAAAMAFISAAP